MPIIHVRPYWQVLGALLRGLASSGASLLQAGSFTQGGLYEALCLAICFWRIRLCPDVFEAEFFTGGGEGVGFITGSIIGHHPFDGDAEVLVGGDGVFQMGAGAVLFLIGEDAISWLCVQHHFDHMLSTSRGKAGIVMDVHSGLLSRGGYG